MADETKPGLFGWLQTISMHKRAVTLTAITAIAGLTWTAIEKTLNGGDPFSVTVQAIEQGAKGVINLPNEIFKNLVAGIAGILIVSLTYIVARLIEVLRTGKESNGQEEAKP